MWGSVLGPHTLTHFPTPPPFLSPHPFPHANTLSHSPHKVSHTPPHTSPLPTYLTLLIPTPQHTSLHPPHLFPQLPSPPSTPQHIPHSPHIFPHSLDYVAKLPCDDVTLINLTRLWKSPIKSFKDNQEFKVLFRCRHCKFSMYESVAKLLATI